MPKLFLLYFNSQFHQLSVNINRLKPGGSFTAHVHLHFYLLSVSSLQIRLKLSVTLRGIVSQSLIRKASGKGRVCIQEVLVNTPFISELIKKGEIARIDDAIRDGAAHGMISKNQSLFESWKRGDISEEDAVSFSNRPTDLKLAIRTAKFEEKEKERHENSV